MGQEILVAVKEAIWIWHFGDSKITVQSSRLIVENVFSCKEETWLIRITDQISSWNYNTCSKLIILFLSWLLSSCPRSPSTKKSWYVRKLPYKFLHPPNQSHILWAPTTTAFQITVILKICHSNSIYTYPQ